MNHIVTTPTPAFEIADGALEVHQIPVWRDNLVWLLVDPVHGEAAAVDGPEAGPVLDYCARRGLKLSTILNTHTHPDHIGINRELGEKGLLEGMRVIGSQMMAHEVPGITDKVGEGSVTDVFGVLTRVMLTEGHINGHICFLIDDCLFCGDTLFAGGCGYLFDGPPEKMHDSLDRLARLPDHTRVCCAHEYTEDNLKFARFVEPDNEALARRAESVKALRARGGCTVPSTMGEERRTNPFMRGHSETIRKRLAELMPDRSLSLPSDVFAAARALKDRGDHKEAS